MFHFWFLNTAISRQTGSIETLSRRYRDNRPRTDMETEFGDGLKVNVHKVTCKVTSIHVTSCAGLSFACLPGRYSPQIGLSALAAELVAFYTSACAECGTGDAMTRERQAQKERFDRRVINTLPNSRACHLERYNVRSKI